MHVILQQQCTAEKIMSCLKQGKVAGIGIMGCCKLLDYSEHHAKKVSNACKVQKTINLRLI